MDWDEFRRVGTTRNQIAEPGREPGLIITRADGTRCSVERGGVEFIKYLEPLADAFSRKDERYRTALENKRKLFENPELTPSARAMDGIHQHNDTFFYFAKAQAEHHEQIFKQASHDLQSTSQFEEDAAASLVRAKQMEMDDDESFETFLHKYFGR